MNLENKLFDTEHAVMNSVFRELLIALIYQTTHKDKVKVFAVLSELNLPNIGGVLNESNR